MQQKNLELQAIIQRLESIHIDRQLATSIEERMYLDGQANIEFSKYAQMLKEAI